MISIKLKFRPSTVDGKEGSLYYQIIYKRVPRQLVTDYKIKASEWNMYSGDLELGQADGPRYDYLSTVLQKVEWDKRRFQQIFNRLLSSNKAFTTDNIIEEFQNQTSEVTLFNYMRNMIGRFRRQGQYRTSETYSSTLNSFSEFRNGVDLYFEDMDSDLLLAYEYHLKSRSLSPNTISFYMKRLRAVYNKATDDGFAENRNLFKRVFTSSEKTIKRAISLKHIKRLKSLDLSYSASKEFARDMFLFSFYTRGMSFVDIAYLQEKDLKGNMLTYRRKKTGQLLNIQWERCMQEIVDKYSSCSRSPYLLPIIKNPGVDLRKQYQNVQSLINRNLKNIGKDLKLTMPLTMYCARHSWASIARSEGIPISVISEGMGHDSESTTQIYLASLETQVIDKANRKILKLL
ncbi:tyrosine-type recombinase/integrase [Bacteroides thetaiotaomicron]|uniref:tyrosine-type recombinase/integrase n=1 Tax=Bacteroides thetaiotaomicron TaxID=818 RepID=UPI0018AAF715|nr:site-specific integrase [Bacteroides thetaiotaomicron]MDC2216125.1 site-specific integrase [Bacteroides thetaiotaomicron]